LKAQRLAQPGHRQHGVGSLGRSGRENREHRENKRGEEEALGEHHIGFLQNMECGNSLPLSFNGE
jgi:hypothetical protein